MEQKTGRASVPVKNVLTPALRRELAAARAARGLPPYAEPPQRRAPAAPMTYERPQVKNRRVPCEACGRTMTTRRVEPPYVCRACRDAGVGLSPEAQVQVLDAARAGEPQAEIARRLGLDREMVRMTIERHGPTTEGEG